MKIGSDLGINRIMNETEPGIGARMARGLQVGIILYWMETGINR